MCSYTIEWAQNSFLACGWYGWVIHNTRVKWHIGRSPYSWTVVWRRAVRKDEESLDDVALIWSPRWVEEQEQTVGVLTPCLPSTMVGILEAERWAWELMCALHGKSRSPNRCQQLSSMALTLCICDLKLYWLLLQLSRLACHWESIIYFCLLYLNKPRDKIWLGTGVAASVWEAGLYCLPATVGCKALSRGPQRTQSLCCPSGIMAWNAHLIYTCSACLCHLG